MPIITSAGVEEEGGGQRGDKVEVKEEYMEIFLKEEGVEPRNQV